MIVVFGWLIFLSISYVFTRLYIYLYEHWVTWRGKRQRLRKQLHNAISYEDWVQASKELDTYLGNDAWKSTDEYAYYDSKTVRRVYDQLVKLRRRVESDDNSRSDAGDQQKAIEDLRALVEACVKNNFVGFENPRLYSETYYGTKNLVQKFIDEVETSLSVLLRTTLLDAENKRALFKHLGTNFGRTALCLSGGATFAYYHFGVAKALLDAGLLPEVITGTSGGALVASLLGTRTDDELKKLLIPALAHRITACSDSMITWMKRWYRTGARFDSAEWAKRCSWFTRGSMTFREAYNRTGRILNVSCVPSDPHSPTILANYLTAPDCVIWSAVLASAAVPGILNPVVLMKKDKDGTLAPYSFGHKWKDGSLRTDIPLKSLNLHFNVRFSIVSQVNPHINIFFFSSRGSVGRPVTHRRGRGWRGGFIGSAIEQYLKLDLTKWLKVLRHLELLPRPMGQDWSEIWLQRFSGTITIWPKSIPSDFYHILSDPTPDRLARMIHVGQQSAFPKLKFIANRAKLERLIQQGRRQFRPRGLQDGNLANILSEDDFQNLVKQSRGNTPEKYLLSGSESSSSAGISRPSSPANVPLGFSFTEQKKRSPPKLSSNTPGANGNEVPSSPSLSERLSGWWSALSPPPADLSHPRPRPRRDPANTPPSTSHAKRPFSMFELHPPYGTHESRNFYNQSHAMHAQGNQKQGNFLKEMRRQSRIFVDDDSDEDEGNTADLKLRRNSSHGDTGPRAEHDELGEGFGDDEDDGEIEAQIQVESERYGLGLDRGEEGVMQ